MLLQLTCIFCFSFYLTTKRAGLIVLNKISEIRNRDSTDEVDEYEENSSDEEADEDDENDSYDEES